MTVREFCVTVELEWWSYWYGVHFDMDVSNPEEISILAVRLPQHTFIERSIYPDVISQFRSTNALQHAFYINAFDLMDGLLNEIS